jgi:hypothetical protein
LKLELPIIFTNEATPGQRKVLRGDIFDGARSGRFLQQATSEGIPSLSNAFYAASAEQYVVRNAGDRVQSQAGVTGGSATFDGRYSNRIGKPTYNDLYQALDIAMQLDAIRNAPPLVLLINPTTLAINYEKVQNFNDKTRHGYVFHVWGENQPKLSFTAKCGAFMSGGRGVQFASKRDSAAWQNLMNLFTFYLNNGYVYDTLGASNAHHFVGGISIHYDGWIYYGSMDSLTYSYEESQQNGGMEFQIEFTASNVIDTHTQNVASPLRSPNRYVEDTRLAARVNPVSDGASNLSELQPFLQSRQAEAGLVRDSRQIAVTRPVGLAGFRAPEVAPTVPVLDRNPSPFRRF